VQRDHRDEQGDHRRHHVIARHRYACEAAFAIGSLQPVVARIVFVDQGERIAIPRELDNRDTKVKQRLNVA